MSSPACALEKDGLSTSEQSCGACGKKCGVHDFCNRSSCVGRAPITTDGITCAAYCQGIQKQCIEGKSNAEYAPGPARGAPACETINWACNASSFGTQGGYDGRCGKIFTFATIYCGCD